MCAVAADPKSVSSNQRKMVPEADLIALKKRLEKYEAENAQLRNRNGQLENEVKITKANLDDDPEVKAVRQHLLDENEDLAKAKEEHQSKVTAFEEREKESLIQSLATELKVEPDLFRDDPNPEAKARKIYIERLESEKNKSSEETTSPAEQVFETAPAANKPKKQIMDMNDQEFAEFEKGLKTQYVTAARK